MQVKAPQAVASTIKIAEAPRSSRASTVNIAELKKNIARQSMAPSEQFRLNFTFFVIYFVLYLF